MTSELSRQLHPRLSTWLGRAFHGRLTEAQEKTLPHILAGCSVLLSSPTGSGKTLAGFLGVLDRLIRLYEAGELGLGFRFETPDKHFIGGCRLCPYMKLNSLEKVRDALAAPRPDQIVTLDEDIRRRAARCIDRMFELAPRD